MQQTREGTFILARFRLGRGAGDWFVFLNQCGQVERRELLNCGKTGKFASC